MKKIIVLVLILISSFAYGQKKDVVCFPSSVAKQMAKDLIIGDSAKALLSLASEEIITLKEKIEYQDTLLVEADRFRSSVEQLAANEKAQKNNYIGLYTNCNTQFAALSRENKRLKVRSRFINILGGAALVSLTTLYLTK